MTSAVYGYRWNTKRLFMIDAISEEEARRRYLDGPWFSVAVGNGLAVSAEESKGARAAGLAPHVPDFSLEITAGATAAKAFFYNEYGSVVAIYNFRRQDERRLFVHSVLFYNYPAEPRYYGQDECLVIDSITFHLDGTSREQYNDRGKSMIDVTDRRGVDLTKNWEPIPAFGNWAGLGRADRRVRSPDHT